MDLGNAGVWSPVCWLLNFCVTQPNNTDMEKNIVLMAIATAVALTLSSSSVQAKGTAATPAPAPAPDYVNLTHLLTVAGPFSTFLSYLESTKVMDTFQSQANNTEQGVTVFVPTDAAFSSLKSPSLKNLTYEQLKSLCLFHGLPSYYSLSDFPGLSQKSPVATLAGDSYTLNFTDVSGTVHLTSGWSVTKVSSSVISTSPVAVYEISKVLLPEAIFGTDIPPTPAPAPAPAPEKSSLPAADSPADAANSPSSTSSSHSNSKSAAPRTLNCMGVVIHLGSLGLLLLLL